MSLVGKKAPLFNARAVINGDELVDAFSLEQYIGNKDVLFFFYPKDFSSVCPTELHAFQDKIQEFEKRGVQIVACSCDTEDTHMAWLSTPKEEGGVQGITYPVVSDPAKTIASNYGVLAGGWNYSEDGALHFEGIAVAFRGTFLIDKEGIIRHESINHLPLGRNTDEFLRLIDAWHHILNFGEVCPANWTEGQEGLKDSREGAGEYLSKQ